VGYYPRLEDSDGDGLSDYTEIVGASYFEKKSDPTRMDPTTTDSTTAST